MLLFAFVAKFMAFDASEASDSCHNPVAHANSINFRLQRRDMEEALRYPSLVEDDGTYQLILHGVILERIRLMQLVK